MTRILTAACIVLALCVAAPAGSVRLPLGNGHSLRVKGHVRALKRSQVTVQTDAGFAASTWGPRYAR